MKVSKSHVSSTGAQSVAAKSSQEAKSHAKDLKSKADIKSSANVNLSDRAQMMQKAKDLASGDSIDEAKVARLQKLIDAGQYKTDASAIADRLVDEHLATEG